MRKRDYLLFCFDISFDFFVCLFVFFSVGGGGGGVEGGTTAALFLVVTGRFNDLPI